MLPRPELTVKIEQGGNGSNAGALGLWPSRRIAEIGAGVVTRRTKVLG